jgi:hypothetical protein
MDRHAYDEIPEYTMSALKRYVVDGIHPGGFLMAVLENDLSRAVSAADDQNIKVIPQIACFIYNRVPAHCWGSREKVSAWPSELSRLRDDDINVELFWKYP